MLCQIILNLISIEVVSSIYLYSFVKAMLINTVLNMTSLVNKKACIIAADTVNSTTLNTEWE